MSLHDGAAVLHCVMLAVFFLLTGGGGGGVEYGLHNMAEKCNTRMSQGKNLLHTNSVFLQSQQQCISIRKSLTLPWEL